MTGSAGAGTVVSGNVGSATTAPTIINFGPSTVTAGFTVYTAADPVTAQAHTDANTAYGSLSQACDVTYADGFNLAGLSPLAPGVYCSLGSFALTGTLTLTGTASDVWIFRTTASTLTTNPGSDVVMGAGGASACNVFWQVGSSATLNGTSFMGTVIADTSITVSSASTVTGRLLAGAVTGAGVVTMAVGGNTIGGCSAFVPPTLSKAFSPATINAGGVSTLTVTLTNTDAAVATLTAAFTDTLPAGVVIAGTPNLGTTCGGGAPVAVAGGSTVTLPLGRTIPASGSCTLTVDVTAASGGIYINNLASGVLVTSNGNNAAAAAATLVVNSPAPPAPITTLGKAFSPATINAGGVATLTVTLSNPNNGNATLTAALIDTLPSGVVIAATPNVATTCTGGGTPVAVAGSPTVTLPPANWILGHSSCTLTVDVTAAVGGSYINTLPAGVLVTTNGNNAAPAVATLTVVSPVLPPTLGKAFSPFTINAGGVSTLTVTLINPYSTAATLTAALIDTLPSGVVIASTPSASTTCGGGAPVAVAGSSTVTLPSGTIPANGSCTLTVNVTAAVGGSYINTLLAGALMTNNGNNAAPAIATLTVVAPGLPPTLGKAFLPFTINAGGVSTLTVTLINTDAAAATLSAALIDTLPGGVVVAPTPSASTTCGGAPVAVAGSSTVTLPSGTIPANGSCTLTVNVTAAVGGSYINTLPAGVLVTSNGSNAAPAIATLTVVSPVPPPTLGKAFDLATINAGGVSMLTVTLSNPHSVAATLTAAFIDTLPSGVVIAPTPSASTTCGGGAPVAVAGSSTVTLPAGRSIPASGSCTVSVNVTAAAGGSYINTLPAGVLVTSNGNNAAPAIATLTVVPPVIPPTSAAGIPTLSEWAMIMLAALLSITGFVAMRRQAR